MKRNLFALALAFAAAAAAADGPVGIRAKWANDAELATTNLAAGELVWNTDLPGDLRVGDGATPGGVSHVARRDNPHAVTLQQLVDDTARDYMAGEWGLSVYPGDGISSIGGFGRVISLEEGYIDGDFSYSSRPSLLSDGLATTNEVAAVADSVSAVSNRVSSIEADYATSGDVAAAVEPLATTASVASVERRLDALESWRDMPETCCLYWPVDFVVANSVITTNYTTVTNDGVVVTNATVLHTFAINQFVTNCPTRRLELTIRDKGIEKLDIKFDPTWTPDSPKEININVISSSGNPTNRATRILLNNSENQYVLVYTAYNQYRDVTLSYDPGSSHYWRTVARARLYASYWWKSDNGARATAPTLQPATVEEWMAAQSGTRSLAGNAQFELLPPAREGDLQVLDDLTVQEGQEATILLTAEEEGNALEGVTP